jgi:hypothetical protein
LIRLAVHLSVRMAMNLTPFRRSCQQPQHAAPEQTGTSVSHVMIVSLLNWGQVKAGVEE